MLVDCGAGDKMAPKQADIYALDRESVISTMRSPTPASRAASIDFALATHLHFDHFGGATVRESERLSRGFPTRRYVDSRRRVGGRHASARAQPRQLSAGRLRAAGGRRSRATSSRAT